MEPWRACRLLVADLHNLHEEQDLDSHRGEKLDPDPHKVKISIWIHIKVVRIRNPVCRKDIMVG
jgi:hypothetical protein